LGGYAIILGDAKEIIIVGIYPGDHPKWRGYED
jgi:hypothetical protein